MFAYSSGRGRCGGPGPEFMGREMSGYGAAGGRHRHRGWGAWYGGGFPFGGPSPGGPFGRGRRARRGDVRTAALLLLAEEPRNGYQIMQELQERSEGVWSPSAGSIYPALSQLEDEGLIRSEEADGRRVFVITDAGRALLAEREPGKAAPWEEMSGDVSDDAVALGKLMREVAFAFVQVMHTAGPAQLEKAREVLAQARRELYGILADGDRQGSGADKDA